MIGEGAYGQVFKGTWRMTSVAIKKMKSSLPEEEEAKFLAEVDLMARMKRHDNVVAFLGVSFNPLCIVTEFLENGSLDKYLESSVDITLEQSITWFREIAAGMYHLHTEKIVHKDLAARNILLGPNQIAKISDFGLSRYSEAQDNQLHSKSNIGPIKWMAPESVQDRTYSIKSDTWMFGVVCIEILTHHPPFPQLTVVDYMTRFMLDSKSVSYINEIPIFVPQALRDIIIPCFSYRPEDRPDFLALSQSLKELEL